MIISCFGHLPLPRSLRSQFHLALSAFLFLIAAGGFTAIQSLRAISDSSRHLAEEHLERLQDAQGLVQRTLLIERNTYRMMTAESREGMRGNYAEIINQLESLDALVARLGQAEGNVSVLGLYQASQLFRNTTHIVARLHDEMLPDETASVLPPRNPHALRRFTERKEMLRHFHGQMEVQVAGMTASAEALSSHFTSTYREEVRQLSITSRQSQHLVLALFLGSLLLAWLVSKFFLGVHVVERLQKVSQYLRFDGTSNDSPRIPVQGNDEIGEMARAVEQFLRDRQQLSIAKEQAEAANRAKSAFLASMSHELRTPLNAVLGFSQLMKNDPDVSAKQKESLDIITRSGEHLLNLINNVLDISKIESGRVELETSHADLYQLVQEMKSLMYARAHEKGLEFTLEQSRDLPRHISVDVSKLRQILINLIGNALKYTKSGGVILRAGVAQQETPERVRLEFEVRDSGPGIRVEDLGRIFQPFVQLADQPVAEAGTGLGLAICKQYVELMGGQFGVASEPGKGSVFYFEIPAAVLPGEEMPAEPRHGRVMGIEEGQPRYRLLIVEDEPENRLLLHELLEPLGFDVREAVNGQEAVEIFEQWRPNLIWMDIRMPVMGGIEATRRIKLTEAGVRTKVIALTAHALEDERREILASGCDDFIRKPYRDSEIFGALARHLGIRFRYGDEYPPTAEKKACEVSVDQLYALPRDLTDELLKAVELLDGPRILDVVRRIGEMDRELGKRLRCMAEDLQYEDLLKILDSLAEKRAL